jgi:uncharacterized protein YndB with AHSA1/START domain
VTDWIELTVRIEAGAATVWSYLVEPTRIREWWGDAHVDARRGGALRVRPPGEPAPVVLGRFVEIRPCERLVFTFGWDDADGTGELPPDSSTVVVTLDEDADGTFLRLRHTDLPAALAGQTTAAWDAHLRKLAAACPTC